MTQPVFDDNAQKIWTKGYAIHPEETILEGFERVSKIAVDWDTQSFIYEMMKNKAFSPGGRVLAGAGTQHQQTNNCFQYDTIIHTDEGSFKIGELEGQTKNVLSIDGHYRPAVFKSYGTQPLLEVTLSNGEVILATPGHDWLAVNKAGGNDITKTAALLGKRVPVQFVPRPAKDQNYEEGLRHGMMYGDGTAYSVNKGRLQLYGTKQELARYFVGTAHTVTQAEDHIRISGISAAYKNLPESDAPLSYWYGFVTGLLATDGNVDYRGSVSLGQRDPAALGQIQLALVRLGIGVEGIRQTRALSPFTGQPAPFYTLRFLRKSLTVDDFVRSDQMANFLNGNSDKPKRQTLEVISVKETGREETVYCCEEPVTHTIVVGSGISTRQCYVLAADEGRYDTLEDYRNFALKLARTTRVGGGIGTNLDPMPTKKRATWQGQKDFFLMIHKDHPDAENLRNWRFRDVTRPEGQQWIENRVKSEVDVIVYDDTHSRDTLIFDMGGQSQLIEVPDSMDGIVNAAFDAMASGAQYVYLDLSDLRPEGTKIAGSGGTSSGAASFGIELFENYFTWFAEGGPTAGPVPTLRYLMAPTLRVVRQGGVRRGAGMATISVNHPDALDFLTCKDLGRELNEGDISTYNISFLVDDAFMQQAVTDLNKYQTAVSDMVQDTQQAILNVDPSDYEQANLEREAEAARFLDRTQFLPREAHLLLNIALHAWMTGEPGLIYVDRINDLNPLRDVDGPIVCTNPCGEISLYPGEPCDLGALNVAAFVKDGVFDEEGFAEAASNVVDFLDDNLDYCKYPVKDADHMSKRNRRIGAGIMGLADALVKLGLPYGSEASQTFTRDLMALYGEVSKKRSEELAELRGVPEWSKLALKAGTISKHRRNVATLTIAPTGTTSMLMGVSSGVEPIYSPFIYRKIGSEYRALVHPLFKEELEKFPAPFGFQVGWTPTHGEVRVSAPPESLNWDWDKVTTELQKGNGSVQGFDWIPEPIRKLFVFAHDVTAEQHVLMQAAAQQGMDIHGVGNAISKTINMPFTASVHDVLTAYQLAHQTECKGVTVYRDGSRLFQVLNTSVAKTESGDAPQPLAAAAATERESAPVQTNASVQATNLRTALHQKVKIEGNSWYVNPGFENGHIVEVFLAPPKGDAFLSTTANVVGRLISQLLQAGVPLHTVIESLRGQHDDTGGLMTGLNKPVFVKSIYDAVATVLEDLSGLSPVAHAEQKAQSSTDTRLQPCPECKAVAFNKAECVCLQCGATRCG